MPGSRKSGEQSPRVGGFKALDSQIDGEANTVVGAVKSPPGSRCFEQSSLWRWRQGKAAVAVRVQRAAVGSVALREVWWWHASPLSISGSSLRVEPKRQK